MTTNQERNVFKVGVGGPVGSGKTALALSMSPAATDAEVEPEQLSDHAVWEIVEPLVDPVLEP